MLKKTQEKIMELLEDNTEMPSLESRLTNIKDDAEFFTLLNEIEEIIIGQAYLKGYKDGVEAMTKEHFKNNLTHELRLGDFKKLQEKMKEPAATQGN